jgi:nicotinamide-nucleotide amidase
MLDAAILAIGSELLTPDKTDTNSLFLTGQLNALGIEVRRKCIIGDDRALLTATITESLQHADLVILTGGLGPTEDDVTRDAVAAALGRELVYRQEICDAIEERFRSRGRKMAEINKRQAYIVAGSDVLANPAGTASGLWIEGEGKVLVLLPGPPSEMRPVFTEECLPRLLRRVPNVVIRTRVYRVTGLTESDLDTKIAPIYTKFENPATTVLASAGDIQVHLRARCATEAEAEALLAEVGEPIEQVLGDHVYSGDGSSLEAVVGQLLRMRGATLAIAESFTAGQLGQRITSVAGSSDYFVGGFLTYSVALKQRLLGVDAGLFAEHTAVSQPVAEAMALGAQTKTGAHYVISTTGEAGPTSSTGAPVGTVFIAVASPKGVKTVRHIMPGNRERVRGFATNAALDALRRELLRDIRH